MQNSPALVSHSRNFMINTVKLDIYYIKHVNITCTVNIFNFHHIVYFSKRLIFLKSFGLFLRHAALNQCKILPTLMMVYSPTIVWIAELKNDMSNVCQLAKGHIIQATVNKVQYVILFHNTLSYKKNFTYIFFIKPSKKEVLISKKWYPVQNLSNIAAIK
jgi:hypothetical protein